MDRVEFQMKLAGKGRLLPRISSHFDKIRMVGKPLKNFKVKDHRTGREISPDALKGKVVLIDFWAPWCGPCRALTPVLEEVADENSNLVVAKMNTDENPDTASQHGIMSIPTMMIFKKGQLVDRLVGALAKPQIMEKLQSHF